MADRHRFADRTAAGRELARHLSGYKNRSDVLVLGLPRGGVPVAAAVVTALGAPLDVFLVRKLGVPGYAELAFGAIAEGGVKVLSAETMRQLGIPSRAAEEVAVRERLELDRRGRLYRGERPAPSVRDRVVIVVDDGLATGATMEAAAMALRQLGAARVIVAAPVGARETCQRLRRVADEVVCPYTPEPFSAVGLWYEDFSQTTDAEVKSALADAGRDPLAARSSMSVTAADDTANLIRRRAIPLTGDPDEYDVLIKLIGNARVVLIGEASHGTHEFYRERALITRRLIAEHGFTAVAVEADWPDAYRVNRFVRGVSDDEEAADALADFRRFPTWMWRNADVLDFVGWLRTHNDRQRPEARAGFYGLDLYSLQASMDAVLAYLRKVDPEAAARARARYACFDRFGGEWQSYAYSSTVGLTASCEREVLGQLLDLRRQAAEYARRDGRIAQDEYFAAEQNARLVRNAEEYYRTMLGGRVESWNLRDRHMTATLKELMTFLKTSSPARPPRLVVWAHNSHLGDARATEMGETGELNVGQLVRESFAGDAVLVGLTTHTGTVTAADDWDGPAHRKHVRPSLSGSWERILHETGRPRLLLPLRTDLELAAVMSPRRLERAIGVIYHPETERRSHYFHARLADQFDAVLHIDETRAVEPLERTAMWVDGEPAETFPTGL
jgi:erythromycin esterase-like protein/predicted phosphoribosyltransferase